MVDREQRKRWADRLTNPEILLPLIIIVFGWGIKLEVNRHMMLKRVGDLERKEIIRWELINDNEDSINMSKLSSQNHSKEADEAIDNIKGQMCDVKRGVFRLESLVMSVGDEDE